MEADFYFRMGSTHKVCQDYALAGVKDGRGYAYVSDGCSGSPVAGDPGSPYTDFGSRFLVRSAQNCAGLGEGRFSDNLIVAGADIMAKGCSLEYTALDATLLAAVQGAYATHVYVTGDGWMAYRSTAGLIHYRHYSYSGNAPYYLNYQQDKSRLQSYLHPKDEDPRKLTVTSGLYNPDSGWAEPRKEELLVSDLPHSYLHYTIANADNDLVILGTDGAESFVNKTGGTLSFQDVLGHVFAIKSFPGEFLVRRCNAFLQRFCAKEGYSHADDFAVAGIYWGKS